MISVKHLQKYFNRGKTNEIHVVNDATLQLPDAGMVAVFGKSGCGKTTLLNCLGGLDSVQSGEILVDSARVSPDADEARNRKIGFIFQNYNLLPEETVYENVAMSLRLCGMTDAAETDRRVMAALSDVGMEKFRSRRPDSLSGGQQQRVAIARALVKSPAILLCDEPTGNLDEQNTLMVMDLLKQISRQHLVVLVTHEVDLVDYYCDRVIEVVDGKIVNDRENSGANGYSAKGKNDVYLGDLPQSSLQGNGMTLQVFGEIGEGQSLRLISVGGVLYLQAQNSAKLRVLDDSCELQIHEGSYQEKKSEERPPMDLSALPPMQNTAHAGRLFRFGNAVRSGWQANFSKQKKMKKFLTGCLALFAAVIVVMMGNFGTVIKQKADIRETYNPNTVYVKVEQKNAQAVLALMGTNGIDHISLLNYGGSGSIYRSNAQENLFFGLGGFETSNSRNNGLRVAAIYLPAKLMEGKKVLAGKGTVDADNEVILTAAAADRLIESGKFSFLTGYNDLLSLQAQNGYHYPYDYEYSESVSIDFSGSGDMMENISYRIVGIVEGSEACVYASDMVIAYKNLQNLYTAVLPASRYSTTAKDEAVPAGMVDIEGTTKYKAGDQIQIGGKTFTVRKIFDNETETETKERWIDKNNFGVVLMNDADYIALADAYGDTDNVIQIGGFNGSSTVYLTYAIHTTDVKATEQVLAASYHEDSIYTPEQAQTDEEAQYQEQFVTMTIVLIVILALMALCLYFVMRSALMSRVREVGIYRAVGVSRKNLMYRFFVETLVLIARTVFIGYLLSSILVGGICSMGTMMEALVFYPVWLALLTLLGILAVCIACGILPVWLLLRRTPAEILAKYDI